MGEFRNVLDYVNHSIYTKIVIGGLRHKGLEELYLSGRTRRIGAGEIRKCARILQLLEPGEQTVSSIVVRLEANQSNISKHLQILRDGGLVNRRRAGNQIYYSIADPIVFQLCELVCRGAAELVRKQTALLPCRYLKEVISETPEV